MKEAEFAGQRHLLTFWQLVTLLVMSTGIVALSIDMMLPALPAIGTDLSVANVNDQQLVITAFLIGFGVAQLAYGPLSDSWGRKPVFLGALVLGAVFLYLAMVMLIGKKPDAGMSTFKYSIFYLMVLFVIMLLDHYLVSVPALPAH